MKKTTFLVAIVLLIIICPLYSHAGIVPAKKRVIFKQNDKEQILLISNSNGYPIIMQTWIDNGDIHSIDPVNVRSPFIIIPPVANLAAGEVKAIRIMRNMQQTIPEDKESAFWINLYEVPPTANKAILSDNITVAMNTQIKLFYRPEKLINKPEEKKLAQQLIFRASTNDHYTIIECQNPTPYHISLINLQLTIDSQSFQNEQQLDMMVPPYGKNSYHFNTKSARNKTSANLLYSFIGDDGNIEGIKTSIAIK